jgi:hypothetical protein
MYIKVFKNVSHSGAKPVRLPQCDKEAAREEEEGRQLEGMKKRR